MCTAWRLQALHERLRERIKQHKESKDPEPLALTAAEIGGILLDCGVEEERASAFQGKCGEQFGDGAALNPANLIESKRFEFTTVDAAISVESERSYLVETRVINGRKSDPRRRRRGNQRLRRGDRG